jgi:hypothetical protein
MGTATVTGGIGGFETVAVGTTFSSLASGNATGILNLIDGNLMSSTLQVGVSTGTATAIGTVNFNDNLAVISDTMTLGDGSTIQFDIDGFLRGIDYGAVDADTAFLDGILDVLFSFTPVAGIFDLILSDSLNGILGDFNAVNIMGLAPGTLFTHGIVIDNNVEIYRLEIGSSIPVPEPSMLLILAPGLMIIAIARRRRGTFVQGGGASKAA